MALPEHGWQPDYIERVNEFAQGFEAPQSLAHIKRAVFGLAAKAYGQLLPSEDPPDYLFHISQTATVTQILLRGEDPQVQTLGQVLAWTHDIGRAFDMGKYHTVAGARILETLGFNPQVVNFSLAHHRWGLGELALANGNFPQRAKEALEQNTTASLLDEVRQAFGVSGLAALLADVSKRLEKPDSFMPTIILFDEQFGFEYIQNLIRQGRLEAGSSHEAIERLGVEFLARGVVPYLEKTLGLRYDHDFIDQAKNTWAPQRIEVYDLWSQVQS